MSQKELIELFFETMEQMEDALFWLNRSYGICEKIGVKDHYQPEEFDAFETLTARFSRFSDMLIQKVFRTIERIEFEKEGSLLDVLNRAHKRGLIDSIDDIRAIRELRNDIAHEYSPVSLKELFGAALEKTEKLVAIVQRIKKYSQKFHKMLEDEDLQ